MAPRRLVLLPLLALLVAVWVAAPCMCARQIAASKGESVSVACEVCPFCRQVHDVSDDTPCGPDVPVACDCGTRKGDVPPRAERPMPPTSVVWATFVADEPALRDAATVPAQEVALAPPDELRRGTVLLR